MRFLARRSSEPNKAPGTEVPAAKSGEQHSSAKPGERSRLDRGADKVLGEIRSLSDISAPLALSYLERIGRPLKALTPEVGVALTSAGYAAHMAVEADSQTYGVESIPVLGTLPDAKGGKPPKDLLLRVVKATRRSFPAIRAVDDETWESFVSARHRRTCPDIDRDAADGLLRFGWVLRQVDLAYGAEPERADS